MNPGVEYKPSHKAIFIIAILVVCGFTFLPDIIARNKQLANDKLITESIVKYEADVAETAEVDAINEDFVSNRSFDHAKAIDTLKTFITDHLDRPSYIYQPLGTLIMIYRSDGNFAEAEQYVNSIAAKFDSATVKINVLRTLERVYLQDGDYSALTKLYTQIVDLTPSSDLTPEERADNEKLLEMYKSHA